MLNAECCVLILSDIHGANLCFFILKKRLGEP